MSNNQELVYNVDLVFCIDVTGSMSGILDTVKANALKFFPDLKAALLEKGKVVGDVRFKVVAFRDFYADHTDAMMESDFFNTQTQDAEFQTYVNGLMPSGGGDAPESGLEALALAIKSDWVKTGDKKRHIIVVWSDTATHPLDKGGKPSTYPSDMPKNFNELTDLWESQEYMSSSAKRMILFAPDSAAWTDIATHWDQTVHYPSRAGEGLGELEYNTILSAIQNSI